MRQVWKESNDLDFINEERNPFGLRGWVVVFLFPLLQILFLE